MSKLKIIGFYLLMYLLPAVTVVVLAGILILIHKIIT